MAQKFWKWFRGPWSAPNDSARWIAAHPVRGALLNGALWGAFMGVVMGVGTHDSGPFLYWLFAGLVMWGPLSVWMQRRSIARWDAEHPATA